MGSSKPHDLLERKLSMQVLSRLLYVSSGANLLAEVELREILEQARSNNERTGITGVLCVGGGYFIQVLEGTEYDLIKLYSKIIDDPRHYDCNLIGISPIQERMFHQWSMAYIGKPDAVMQVNQAQLMQYKLHHDEGKELIRILRRFLDLLK